jgi:hypothetical protein
VDLQRAKNGSAEGEEAPAPHADTVCMKQRLSVCPELADLQALSLVPGARVQGCSERTAAAAAASSSLFQLPLVCF